MYKLKAKIGDLCQPTRQRDPRHNPEDSFFYIDISTVDKDNKCITSPSELLGEEAPSRARKEVKADDILVSTVRPNLNAVAQVPQELDGEIASTGFCVLRPDQKQINHRYLFYWTLTSDFIDHLVSNVRGANYPAVTDNIVKETLIPLPPLSEQRRIVELLDQADALRKKRAEADAKAQRILPALFIKMFGDPVTNPKGWDVIPVKSFAKVQGGLQVTSKRKENPISVPYLRVANVYRDSLNLSEIKDIRVTESELKRVTLKKGDILIVEGHGNRNEIGRSAIWDGSIDPCVHQNHLIRVRTDRTKAEPTYISAYLNSSGGREQLFRLGKTTSGLNTISTSNVKETSVILPPVDKQEKYVQHVRDFKELEAKSSKQTEHIETLFQTLLHRAFSGDLTAEWRKAHMAELLQEMEHQARVLGLKGGVE